MRKIDLPSADKLDLLRKRLKEMGIQERLPEPDPIPRRGPGDFVPLSFNQEGLWFINQLAPDQPNYNIPGTLRFSGTLDVEALRLVLEEILKRHEVLRTVFRSAPDGSVEQVIQPASTFDLPIIDLSGVSQGEYESEAIRLATVEARSSFDLEAGPLFRAFLVRRSVREHVLVFNMHHIVGDGWSLGVFRDELKALYTAFSSGQPSPLPPLPIQYGDFAIWERQTLADAADALAFWRENLNGAPAGLDLPADFPRPAVLSYNGGHHRLDFDRAFSDALRERARQEGMTLYVYLMAAFNVLLALLAEQEDLVIGTGVANRGRGDLEGLIGFFVRILPVRLSLTGDPTFRSLLPRIRRAALEAINNQLPLSMLVKDLKPPRDPSRNPFFQVEFTLLTPDVNPAIFGSGISMVNETIRLPELEITPFEVEGGISRFDLAVFIWDIEEGLSGTFEYCADLFEHETIRKWITQYKNILQLTLNRPDVRVSEIAGELLIKNGQPAPKIGEDAMANMRKKFGRAKRKSINQTDDR